MSTTTLHKPWCADTTHSEGWRACVSREVTHGDASSWYTLDDRGELVIEYSLGDRFGVLTRSDAAGLAASLTALLQAWRAACSTCGWSTGAATYTDASKAARGHADTCPDASTTVEESGR